MKFITAIEELIGGFSDEELVTLSSIVHDERQIRTLRKLENKELPAPKTPLTGDMIQDIRNYRADHKTGLLESKIAVEFYREISCKEILDTIKK